MVANKPDKTSLWFLCTAAGKSPESLSEHVSLLFSLSFWEVLLESHLHKVCLTYCSLSAREHAKEVCATTYSFVECDTFRLMTARECARTMNSVRERERKQESQGKGRWGQTERKREQERGIKRELGKDQVEERA